MATTNEASICPVSIQLQKSPPKKRLRPDSNMKDDARDRDSLGEFQSSIFDASDGHQLVDFIRKKKGLRTQPLKIFDDVRTERQSLQIEIKRLDDHEKTLEPEEPNLFNAVENVVPPTSPTPDESRFSHRSPSRTSAAFNSKVKLKRLTNSIGRRTLLKEFEKTIQESAFLPPTFSTPMSSDLPNPPAINVNNNTQNESALPKTSNITSDKQSNFRLVCSPITLTDNDSPSQEIANARPEKTLTPTESDNTEIVMRQLQRQNDFLLELAQSNKNLLLRESSPDLGHTEQNKENPKSPVQSPICQNRTSIPSKEQRRTYTIQRDNTSGKLILSLDKSIENSVRQPFSPKTPVKNTIDLRNLVVTPEQKKLLLSRFGRNSTKTAKNSQKAAIDQNTSSKCKSITSESTHVSVFSRESHHKEAANVTVQPPEHQNSAQIIEQIQKSGPSNVPVIVIPVNQTFNQASNSKSPTKSSTYVNSPNSNEITSTTTTTAPQPKPPDCSSVRKNNLLLNNLRLEDIITEDESSSTDESARTRLYTRKSANASIQNANRSLRNKKKISMSLPPSRNSSHHIREVVSPQQLMKMDMDEVLDLRKRNSNGDLRKLLSKRESYIFDKQIELELLRRSIQEKNYEDEVLQMEVLPAPPEEFSDRRRSSRRTLQIDKPAAKKDDFVDERSSDRISLVPEPKEKLSQATTKRKPRGKKKEMSEQLANYLEASQRISSSKYLNLSKRKLYNKGNSDVTSSDDNSPDRTASFRKSETSARMLKSPRKSYQHKSVIDKTPTKTQPRPINTSAIDKSPLALFSTTPINPPADFADQSKAQIENEIFKKPIGKPPRKRTSPRKPKPLTENRSAVSPPVEPDYASSTTSNLSESSAVRRSTRAKKAPTAYWSCSKYELRPMFDIYRAYATSIESKKVKNVSSKRKKLVVNTKTKQSNSVANKQTENESNRRIGKSNKQADSTDSNSICPPYCGSRSSSDYQFNFPTTNFSEASAEDQRNPSSDATTIAKKASKAKKTRKTKTDKSESQEIPNAAQDAIGNKEKQGKSKLRGPKSRKGSSTDSESVSSLGKAHSAALTTIMESSHSEKSHSSRISDLKETSRSKSKSRGRITIEPEFTLSTSTTTTTTDQQLHDATKTSKKSKKTERRPFSSDEDGSSSVNDLQLQVEAKASDMKQMPAPKSKKGSNFSSHASESSPTETSQPQNKAKTSKLKETNQKSKRRNRKHLNDKDMSSSSDHELKSIGKKSNLKGSTSKIRYLSSDTDSASIDNTTKKSTTNNHQQQPSASYDDCVSENNPSSIQQIRHSTTVAKDSVPEFEQQITISVSELEEEQNTHHRLGTKSITSIRDNLKKDTFRTEHDRSIADVSSEHVNKLFDQLKSSSMCTNGEVTVKRVNYSGQVAQDNRVLNDQSLAQPKCKNFTVRVLRSRQVMKSPEGNDKVCDSGFSSEDVSSEHKQQRGDILLNWLKQIISKSPIDSQKGVARFLQSDGFHAARVDDLVFQEVDGVDYAFYNTKQRFSFGYMRFNPKTEKKRCAAKKYELNFLVLCGSVNITVNGNTFDCKNGDLITVFIGTLYGICNNSNDPALVMVIKK